jgi:glycosyltransferase involved in cell wall biosynthesis
LTIVASLLVALPLILGIYAYLLYPGLLRILRTTDNGGAIRERSDMPLITVVLPAYNEERQIAGAIESLLAQSYPQDRMQILVLSDASTDRTDDIVRGFAHRGVELFRMAVRGGKTAAENASVSVIKGDIIINTDASVRLHSEAIRHLIDAMSDDAVGVASTRDQSVGVDDKPSAEAGYVGYEMRVRQLETGAGGIVGASGSGYAIRSSLHRLPVRDDLSRDFSAALTAHRHGFRAISVEHAVCFVPRTPSLRQEFKRKVRTISRGMETLYFNRDLMSMRRHGSFAFKLISHKVIRWLVPLACLPAGVGLLMLAYTQVWARLAVIAALAMLLGGIVAIRLEGPLVNRLFPRRATGLIAANLAVIVAAWRFVVGHEDHMWEPTRRDIPING